MSYGDDYDRRRRSPPRDFDRRGPPPMRDYDRGYNSGPPKRPYGNGPPMYDRGMPPPPKRVRDWGEDTYDPQMPKRSSDSHDEHKSKPLMTQILMSFKQFLASQDDSITDEDAIKNYNEYKVEFKRKQLHQFFIEHKDEEWFSIKYQPEQSAKLLEQYLVNVRRRLQVFQWLMDKGYVTKARLDADNQTNILKILDALVVKLEDGTDEDVEELVVEYDEDDIHQHRKQLAKKKDEEAKRFGAKDAEDLLKDDDEEEVGVETNQKEENGLVKNGEENGKEVEDDSATRDSLESGEMELKEEKKKAASKEDEIAEKDNIDDEAPVRVGLDRKSKTKNLHKTSSIFLRNVAASIKKTEIEELCKRFPGFLRVGLADPDSQREYSRRGWISFRRDVNIKEICWNLSSIRIRDCDFGAIVNRDLARRIRVVNGTTAHKTVAQHDLRLAARLCQIFDARAKLWQEEDAEAQSKKKLLNFDLPKGIAVEMGIRSSNPLLENIEDMLIEEASAEEDELLGRNSQPESKRSIPFERDDVIIKALDQILIYLRLVHSIDFYNHTDYPHEDEMPNRCGLIHVRGSPPSVKEFSGDDNGHLLLPAQFIADFCQGQQSKMTALLDIDAKVDQEEVVKLGRKDPAKEVEAFITANCVELSKDKWTCPLSGKKFKGPEFVRKHILGKHSQALDEVAAEVTYFNNYLLDAHRPQPPAPDENALQQRSGMFPPPLMGGGPPGGDYRNRGYNQPQWDNNRGGPPSGPYRGGSYNRGPPPPGGGGPYRGSSSSGGGGGYRRESSGSDRGRAGFNAGSPGRAQWTEPPPRTPTGRDLISYKDLDAPDDVI